MKFSLSGHTKSFVFLAAIALGFLLSLNGWDKVFAPGEYYPLHQSLFVLLLQFAFLSLLGWIIWSINLFSKIRSWQLKLIVSFVVLMIFLTVQRLCIEPYVHGLNDIIRGYERPFMRFYDMDRDWFSKSFIVFIISYMSSWLLTLAQHKMEAQRNYQELEKEALQSKISALTTQINPHFFFNSLNSLYSLVFNDQKEKSLEYITKISVVFRYIMQSEEKRLVTLEEEIDFLNTYLFMLLVKYDKKLKVEKEGLEPYYNYELPTLTLLPLIENVTKHNEVSSTHPMTVHIYIDDAEQLVFSNNKQERLDVLSVGLGLSNLSKRFKLICGKEITIQNSDETFTVRLPLCKPRKL